MSIFETESYADTYGDWSPEYADYSDYSDYSEYAEAGPKSKYKAPKQPQPGGNYAKTPSAPGYVTPDQLRQALARVKQDIDKVANGVKANTANLNDFAGRTGRNFHRMREEQKKEIARLDQAVAGARDLGVLGAVLAGGDKASVTLPLLVVAMDQQSQQAVQAGGASTAGGILGSGNTGLVLALAVSGMIGK